MVEASIASVSDKVMEHILNLIVVLIGVTFVNNKKQIYTYFKILLRIKI